MIKKIGVVILNFKVKDLAVECIKSIQKSTYSKIEIIVVDNNSQDGLEESLPKGVEFLQTGANLGYTGGNNNGIKKALEMGADYIFVINPDAEITPSTIKNLVEFAEDHPEGGIFGPKVLFADKKTLWFAGGQFDLANVLGSHRGVDQKDQGQYDKPEQTQYVTGGAMFIRAEVLSQVGLFDEQYFMYYEDSDLCYRAHKKGWELWYVPTAVVYHGNGKSAGLGSPLQDYFITRNRMLYAKKFLSLRTQFALFREALRNFGNPVRRMAFVDFMTGNLGKGSFIK